MLNIYRTYGKSKKGPHISSRFRKESNLKTGKLAAIRSQIQEIERGSDKVFILQSRS
jgi:hypothetical protein